MVDSNSQPLESQAKPTFQRKRSCLRPRSERLRYLERKMEEKRQKEKKRRQDRGRERRERERKTREWQVPPSPSSSLQQDYLPVSVSAPLSVLNSVLDFTLSCMCKVLGTFIHIVVWVLSLVLSLSLALIILPVCNSVLVLLVSFVSLIVAPIIMLIKVADVMLTLSMYLFQQLVEAVLHCCLGFFLCLGAMGIGMIMLMVYYQCWRYGTCRVNRYTIENLEMASDMWNSYRQLL
jgi:hypothetical protein